MLVTIRPAPGGIGGVIAAPPSKSMAHRAVLCAALAVGRSHITHLEFSKDISDRKSTRLNSSHWNKSRMPSSA